MPQFVRIKKISAKIIMVQIKTNWSENAARTIAANR